MQITPLMIEILIHYHCTGGLEYPHPSPAASGIIHDLVRMGLLEPVVAVDGRAQYSAVREATTAYIEALCAVPLPVKQWMVLPRTA